MLNAEQLEVRRAEVKKMREEREAIRELVRSVVREEMARLRLDFHVQAAVLDDGSIRHFQDLS